MRVALLLAVALQCDCTFDESGVDRVLGRGGDGGVVFPDVSPPPPIGNQLATYLPGTQKLNDILKLADGTLLVVGSTTSLDWVPSGVARTELEADQIKGSPESADIGFILQISADLQRLLHFAHLPTGAAFELRSIKTDAMGTSSSNLYVSGTTNADKNTGNGSFIGRLDGNFINGVPNGFAWVHNFWTDRWQREADVWDVDGLGRVIFATGADFDWHWLGIYRLDASGRLDAVEDWRNHWGSPGAFDEQFSPISSRPDLTVDHSAIVLKIPRCGLRSWTKADYEAKQSDGNGRQRQGRWPFDAFAAGPCDPKKDRSNEGAGYTGLRMYDTIATHRAAGIVTDRRTNDLFVSVVARVISIHGRETKQSAVIAFDSDGELRWWSRLNQETEGTIVSEVLADQLRIDYLTNSLVVAAHSVGPGDASLWPGDGIAGRQGRGFHSRPTGDQSDLDLGWLGKLDLSDGQLAAATFVGTYGPSLSTDGQKYTDAAYSRWPDHDDQATKHQLFDTSIDHVAVDEAGRVMVAARGLRAVTTNDALMQASLTEPAPIAAFARIYASDLGSLHYSTLVRGAGGGSQESPNVMLRAVTAAGGSVIVVGHHVATSGAASGSPMPTADVPSWGVASPQGESGVLLRLP